MRPLTGPHSRGCEVTAKKKNAKKTATKRLYLVQLSSDGPGYNEPPDDLSDHKQFIFAVEATGDRTMVDTVVEFIEEKRKDASSALSTVSQLHIDWIIEPAKVRPGLLWEYSIATDVKTGAAELYRSFNGVGLWENADGGGSLFLDFDDEKDESTA